MTRDSQQKEWMAQWKSASIELANERFNELHHMSITESNRRVGILFRGFTPDYIPRERQRSSGFVAMQRYFRKWKP